MSNSITFLFSNELDISAVNPFCLLFYLIAALLMVGLIRFFGPHSISVYRLENDYDDSTGAVNVIYRIIAPVVWCYFLLLVCAICLYVCGINFTFHARWIPVALYWLEMLFLKLSNRPFTIPLWAFLLEAFVSIAISIYFDWAVVSQLPESGLLAVDQSNIGFQVAAALFFAVVEIVMAAAIRRKYMIGYVLPFNIEYAQTQYYRMFVPTEKRLYEYKRRFEKQLPKRFSEDILLRVIFYSIMCIEDLNRPRSARILENLLARFGAAKTTGIMQQKADKPLTDEESVELAIPYIEDMWNRYLAQYAKSIEAHYSDSSFTFTDHGYCYDYSSVASVLADGFSLLYGDYCGTRTLQANLVFDEVRRFEERENYGLMPERVIATGAIFPEECSYIPNEILYWSDINTIKVRSPVIPQLQVTNQKPSSADELLKMTTKLRNLGFTVISVTFGPAVFQRIQIANGEKTELTSLGDDWSVDLL